MADGLVLPYWSDGWLRFGGLPQFPQLVATESQDTAKLELFRSALSRARFNKSIGKFADKAFATKDRLVKAAYDEAIRHSANAWKPELQSALKNDFFDARRIKRKGRDFCFKINFERGHPFRCGQS